MMISGFSGYLLANIHIITIMVTEIKYHDDDDDVVRVIFDSDLGLKCLKRHLMEN